MRARITTASGAPLYLLGIDAENVRRLQAGHPIRVDLAPLGGLGEVHILYGHTIADIVAELREAGLNFPEVIQPHAPEGHA